MLLPVPSQRVDDDHTGTELFCNALDELGVKLLLNEDHAYAQLLSFFDECLYMLRRRLLAILLDDELLETILLCKFREGRMVDDEGTRGNIGELLFYRTIYVLQALCEALVTRIILCSVRRVNTAERVVYTLTHGLKPAYTCPVVWVVKMSGGTAVVMCRPYQVLIETYEL